MDETVLSSDKKKTEVTDMKRTDITLKDSFKCCLDDLFQCFVNPGKLEKRLCFSHFGVGNWFCSCILYKLTSRSMNHIM